MKRREIGRTGLLASEIGLGCEHLDGKPYERVEAVIRAALDGGVNLLDVFMAGPQVRTNIGRALKGRRGDVLLQGHLGAAWKNEQYARTRDAAECERYFTDLLDRIGTDYIDIGLVHFVDTQQDLDEAMNGGVFDLAHRLKAKGVVRAVGVSSHSPEIARKIAQSGAIDMMMFSINPAYDALPPQTELDSLFQPETYAGRATFAMDATRARLYQTCQALGVGITVMKSLAGGALLSEKSSPFGCALSSVQCAHYALTRPAVASVLVGCQTEDEVRAAVGYASASEEERDFSAALARSPRFSMEGRCMYCNHCLPCPARIDVAKVNQYLDLAEMAGEVPATVAAHYAALEGKAGDCLSCGSCEANCPFHVPVIERMRKAARVFGA